MEKRTEEIEVAGGEVKKITIDSVSGTQVKVLVAYTK
jgi:hypothetical protein